MQFKFRSAQIFGLAQNSLGPVDVEGQGIRIQPNLRCPIFGVLI